MKLNIKQHISENLILYSILLIGLILRLTYLWEYSLLPDWTQLTVDNNFHHHWALSIKDGNILGDTTYFRAPFYVFYLAFIYKIFGVSLWAVRLFGILPGLLGIVITYLTAKEIYNKQTGLIAGLLHAVYPIIYYFESELLLDSLFTLLFQISIYFFIKWWKHKEHNQILFSGLFLGLASITRPTALVFIVLIFFMIYFITSKRAKPIALFLIGSIICIAPIFVRNIVIADDPVLIASQGGINLYVGNNDAADGISAVLPEPLGYNWHIQQITYLAEKDSGKKLTQGEVSSYWMSKAINWITDNPLQFMKLYVEKLYHNISNREISNNRYLQNFFNSVKTIKYNYLSFGILFTLSILSILLTGRENKQALFIVGVIIIYICLTSLFFFSSRFRLPLIPLYIILSSYALIAIRVLLQKKRSASLKIIAFAVIVGLLSFYPIVSYPKGSKSSSYTAKGLYYSANNKLQKALAFFTQANNIDKDYPENNLNLGATFLRLGMVDSASYYINREKQLHPLQSKGFTNSASIYFSNDEYDSAYIDIQKSLELEPFDIIANQLYIRILFKQQISIFDLQKRLGEIRNNTDDNIYLLNEMALLIYNDSTLQNSFAISILQDAIETSPPPIEIDDASFAHNSPNKKSAWTQQIAKSHYHIGYIYGISGNFPNAILHSKKSIELDSTFAQAYVNLVSGYLSINQREEGMKVLTIALQKFPQQPNLLKIQSLLQ